MPAGTGLLTLLFVWHALVTRMGQTCPGWLVLSQHCQTSSHQPLVGSLESPPRSPMQEMRTYTECEQAGKTVGFELVESRDLATACCACGSWYVQDWWSVPCVSGGALQREGSKPQPAMPAPAGAAGYYAGPLRAG